MINKITKINENRLENDLILYTKSASHQTNTYGYEVAILKDIALSIGTNVHFPEGGRVLSGHGSSALILSEIELGGKILIDEEKREFERLTDPYSVGTFFLNRYQELYQELLKKNQEEWIYFDPVSFNRYQQHFLEEMENLRDLLNNSNLSKESLKEIKEKIVQFYNILKVHSEEEKILQYRAIWHRPNPDLECDNQGMKKFVKKLKELHFNVLFVETFYAGRVCYNSRFFEKHPSLQDLHFEGFEDDYLKCLIHFCDLEGIEVHAWNHTLNAGIEAIPMSERIEKEWLLENYQGSLIHETCYGGNYYLDPSNPDVIQFVSELFLEQVQNYGLKGLQYDYVRYFENDYHNLEHIIESGFGKKSEEKFRELYQIEENLDLRKAIREDLKIRQMFFEYRQNNVTNLVKKVSQKLRQSNPAIILSGSVVGELEHARNTYMQDWIRWVNEGSIDMLNPMIYTGSEEHVGTVCLDILNKIGRKNFLVSGIAPLYYKHPLIQNQLQISRINSVNCHGYSLFATHNVLFHEEVENLLKISSNWHSPISLFEKEKLISGQYERYLKKKYLSLVEMYQEDPKILLKIFTALDQFNRSKDLNELVEMILNLEDHPLKKVVLKDLFYLKNIFEIRKNLQCIHP